MTNALAIPSENFRFDFPNLAEFRENSSSFPTKITVLNYWHVNNLPVWEKRQAPRIKKISIHLGSVERVNKRR